MSRFHLPLLASALLVAALPARAEQDAAMLESGRYVLERSGEGFIRLDTRTGAVSHCATQNGAWTCRAVTDDRQGLQDEVAKLAEENRKLKAQVAELERQAGPATSQGGDLKLPSDADMNRLMTWAETWMRRLMAFARSLTQDPQDNSI